MARRPLTYLPGYIPQQAQKPSMRLPKLTPETMTPRQRELHDKIAGKRGKVGAPYQVWLYSPELCERVEALGAYLRWDSASPEYRELSLLMAARAFDAQYSWNAHADAAIKEGVRPETLAAIAESARRRSTMTRSASSSPSPPRCWSAISSSRKLRRRPQGVRAARNCRHRRGAGDFSMLGMLLNTFEVDLQKDQAPPYPDIRGYARVSAR
jgi:4-carboxymuconolactone decarboxylase